MRTLIAACACALGVLATSGGALAGVGVGVNDDAGKYANGAPQFWQTMGQNGLRQNAMTVLWDETRPDAILDESFIRKSLPAAQAAGIEVVFDVYPMRSRALTSDAGNIQRFAAFVGKLARTFPSVRQYVVMNECNQTRFLNPQFDGAGRNQSAAICGQALAAAYDTLKAIDSGIFVWGIGLSPRGNDNANAKSNVSTSPVKFLGYLGDWYRSSGRKAPIMDGFDFHPYPIPQSLDFAKGYADKDNASVSNLDRIYQAFYDAFKGTGQRTIGQQAGGGLPVSLNEVGIQTGSTGRAGYTGVEASASGNGGVFGPFATEQFQADWYVKMLDLVACDPNVEVVNIFHLVDETDLGAWQSGLYYVGYAPKASAGAVAGWIAQTGGECRGARRAWKPNGSATAGGTAGGVTIEEQVEQIRRGMASATAGDFGSYLSVPFVPDVTAALGDLFSTFSGMAQKTLADFVSAKPEQKGQVLFQGLADMLTDLMGKFDTVAQVVANVFPCSASCTPGQMANLAAFGAGNGVRTTASAAAKKAPRSVAAGRATVRAGAQARVKLRLAKGAKKLAPGRYVLVLRIQSAAKRSSLKPAAVALTFTMPNAKPVRKAKPVKKAKPAKGVKKAKHVKKAKQGKKNEQGKPAGKGSGTPGHGKKR